MVRSTTSIWWLSISIVVASIVGQYGGGCGFDEMFVHLASRPICLLSL